jgi:hypothetical protein
VRFMLINFLCVDMEQMHDTTLSDFMVRRDVPRNAGGDSRTYINTCSGCHAGMDPLANAFNFLDYRETIGAIQNGVRGMSVRYVPAQVADSFDMANASQDQIDAEQASKVTRNYQNFPEGYRPTKAKGDLIRWVNQWTVGQNSVLGFRSPAMVAGESNAPSILMGDGPKSLGRVFGATTQFSRCMVQRAFSSVCNRKAPYSQDELAIFATLAEKFDAANRSGKVLFQDAALACIDTELAAAAAAAAAAGE